MSVTPVTLCRMKDIPNQWFQSHEHGMYNYGLTIVIKNFFTLINNQLEKSLTRVREYYCTGHINLCFLGQLKHLNEACVHTKLFQSVQLCISF